MPIITVSTAILAVGIISLIVNTTGVSLAVILALADKMEPISNQRSISIPNQRSISIPNQRSMPLPKQGPISLLNPILLNTNQNMDEFFGTIDRMLRKYDIDQQLPIHLAKYTNDMMGTTIPLVDIESIKTDNEYDNVLDEFINDINNPSLKQILINMKTNQHSYNYESVTSAIAEFKEFIDTSTMDNNLKALLKSTTSIVETMDENVRNIDPYYNSDVFLTEQSIINERLVKNNVKIQTIPIYENDDVTGYSIDITSNRFFDGKINTQIYKSVNECGCEYSYITRILLDNFILSKYVKGDDDLNLFEKCILLNVDEEKVILYSELKLTLFRMMNKRVNKKTINNLLCAKIKNRLGEDYQVYFDLLRIVGNIQNIEGLKVKEVFKCRYCCRCKKLCRIQYDD